MMCIDVVNVVLEKECEVIVLIDSLKFGVVYLYFIGFVEWFNCVIIDLKICVSDLMYFEYSKFIIYVVDI